MRSNLWGVSWWETGIHGIQMQLGTSLHLLSLHRRYADGSHVKYSRQDLHNIMLVRFWVINMQYSELPVKISSSHTSPNRALIFKGTKSSARVTPTLTIAVAAPAS